MIAFCGLSSNLDQHLLQAALPLLQSGKVDALEWSFDTLYNHQDIPDWFVELLRTFGNEGRLVGHGVYYSLFSAKFTADQKNWLTHLGRMCTAFRFDHITEHFGFMTGRNFHEGAPLSVPFNKTTLAIGQDRLKRMSAVCQCPVGIENLAYAYSPDDVSRHGDFLEKLVAPVNGFIILDLHNVYCQAHNFDLDPKQLIDQFPLQLVREIHLSGGSWESSEIDPGRQIRRDTHDDGLPSEIFDLLSYATEKCPSLKFIMLEQIGISLYSEEKRFQYQKDFEHIRTIVQNPGPNPKAFVEPNFLPGNNIALSTPVEDEALFRQQRFLAEILENAGDYNDAKKLLEIKMSNTDWQVEHWQPHMLETAIAIAQKWKQGFNAQPH